MSAGGALPNPLSPLCSLNLDPKMMTFQTSIFEVLMESVLKMSNVMDLKVFILFEDVEKKRHFGGHEDLCDLYNDGILEAQRGDIELAAGKTDLRIVHKSEGVRGRLYDHQPISTSVDVASGSNTSFNPMQTSVFNGNPAFSAMLFSNASTAQPHQQQQPIQQHYVSQQHQHIHPSPQVIQHTAADQQQIVYQQLYQQLQSILLPDHNPTPMTSSQIQSDQHKQNQISNQRAILPAPAPPSAPSRHSMSTRYPRAPPLSEVVSSLSNLDEDSQGKEEPDNESIVAAADSISAASSSAAATFSDAASFADESGVKMSKRNILMADLEEESSSIVDNELDDAVASDSEAGVPIESRKRAGSQLCGPGEDSSLIDAKVPKINEMYTTDPTIEQKIKKMEEDIGFDIAKEYHDKTKHLLANLRQPRQPNTPLTPSNFDGRMQQIVAKHHASQIIVHPPVGTAASTLKNNPLFQQPQVIYQNRVVALPTSTSGRALAPKPKPTLLSYPGPGPGPTGDTSVPSAGKSVTDPTPGYTTIILKETKPATINSGGVLTLAPITSVPQLNSLAPLNQSAPSNKPRIILAPATAVGRSVAAKKDSGNFSKPIIPSLSVGQGSSFIAGPSIIQGPSFIQGAPIIQGSPIVQATPIQGMPIELISRDVRLMTNNIVVNEGVGAGSEGQLTTPSIASNFLTMGPGSSTASSSSRLLSDLADGIMKSGVLNSNNLNELGPQLEASIKAAVGVAATSSAPSYSNPSSSTAITSLPDFPSYLTPSKSTSLSSSVGSGEKESSASGGNQAELIMRLYHSLAEVVFGSTPPATSSAISGAESTSTTASSNAGIIPLPSETSTLILNADQTVDEKPFVSKDSSKVISNSVTEDITQNGIVIASSISDVTDSKICSEYSMATPFRESAHVDGAPILNDSSSPNCENSADSENVTLIDRTNDVGSPESTESAEGIGGPTTGQPVMALMAGSSCLGEGDNVCHICQYRFRRISHLRQHIQEVHEKERRFSCDLCNRLFKRAEHVRKHLRTVHKRANPAVDSVKKDKGDCIVLT